MRVANESRSPVFNFAFRIPHSALRQAFTLIELLVVIAIIILISGITLLALPKNQVILATKGGDQLQTYLASAKSRALRDNAPRGVRFIPSSLGGFREFQQIEVPDPFVPDPNVTAIQIAAGSNIVTLTNGDYRTSIGVGDMLEITYGSGSIHRITGIGYSAPNTSISLASVPSAVSNTPLTLSNNYRFIRQPRPLMGEPSLQLPDKVFVQFNGGSWPSSQNIPLSYDNTNFDIVFSPSGQVINASGGRIILVLMDDNNVSTPSILCVYANTGGVASHPKGPGGDEYQYTRDGRSSGQ